MVDEIGMELLQKIQNGGCLGVAGEVLEWSIGVVKRYFVIVDDVQEGQESVQGQQARAAVSQFKNVFGNVAQRFLQKSIHGRGKYFSQAWDGASSEANSNDEPLLESQFQCIGQEFKKHNGIRIGDVGLWVEVFQGLNWWMRQEEQKYFADNAWKTRVSRKFI